MYKKTIIFSLILFLSLNVFSQEKLTYQTIDTKTYNSYLAGKWKDVISVGKESKKLGIDFYYLQYRMAIAYFQLKNFRKAIPLFEGLYKENQVDETAAEYLYFSYLYSGRNEDATFVSSSFSESLKKKLRLDKNYIFTGCFADGGYTSNQNYDTDNSQTINSLYKTQGERTLLLNQYYGAVGLTQNVGQRTSLMYSFSRLLINNTQQISTFADSRSYSLSSTQKQFYVGMNYLLKPSVNLFVAAQYLGITYQDIYVASLAAPRLVSYDLNNFVLFSSISKDFSWFKLSAGASYFYLNNNRTFQPTIQFVTYPFGNLNLYTISDVNFNLEMAQTPSTTPDKATFKQKIGFKLFKYCWLEGHVSLGNFSNFAESNGYVVFNDLSVIKKRFGANVIIPVKRLEITLRYQYLNKENTATTSAGNYQYNFNTHSIIGGVKWTF